MAGRFGCIEIKSNLANKRTASVMYDKMSTCLTEHSWDRKRLRMEEKLTGMKKIRNSNKKQAFPKSNPQTLTLRSGLQT